MQLTLSRVYWRWCVFPLHNQSLTHTLADYRFLVTIILGGDSWTLILFLWLNPNIFPFPTTLHLIKRHDIKPHHRLQRRGAPATGWQLHWGQPCLVGLSFACLIVCIFVLACLILARMFTDVTSLFSLYA
jgi:hypothetical protein